MTQSVPMPDVQFDKTLASTIEARGPSRNPMPMPEAIIGDVDFQPVSVLDRAVAQAKSVGRVVVRDSSGKERGFGTASLIGRDLLLTNAHVLPDLATASQSSVQFNFLEADANGQPIGDFDEYELDGSTFAVSPYHKAEDGGVDHDHLDFAVVGVRAKSGKSASDVWGRTEIDTSRDWFGVGHDVFIVQHPSGRPKHVSLARNEIVQVEGSLTFHYLTDTLPGSSGSAVLDQTWSMVGLHHASSVYRAADMRNYPANEAIQIWAILGALPEEVRARVGT